MPIILRKSMRDLMVRFRSTLTAILALTIGLWGIGTLLVSMQIMNNDLSENFLQTRPVHISVMSKEFDKLRLDELRLNPDIQAAEFRDRTILRVEVKPDEWLPLWLYSVDEFEQLSVAKFYRQRGSFSPDAGSIVIERDGLRISDFDVGSVVRVQSRGKVIETRLSGIVFDPGQAPSTQDQFIYAYTGKANYSRLSGNPAGQRLIIRFADVETKQDVSVKFDQLTKEFSKSGIAVDSIHIPDFNEHPHQFQLNTLLYLNGTIGLLSFAMAMVLVSQLMSSIFTQQIRQIGVMKAIGATRAHIFKIYAAYILAMSLASVIIGLPLAIMTGKAYSAFVAGILNFDVLTTQIPPAIYIVIISLGFILPILFSLPALLKGINIPVNDALGDYGIKADGGTASNKNTAKAGSSILSLSIRNVGRRKGRMIVTMITMALGVAIFLTGFNVRQSLSDFLDNASKSLKYDIQVVLKQTLPLETAKSPFANIAAIRNVEGWVSGAAQVQSNTTSAIINMTLIATPFDSALEDRDMIQGTWLTGSEELEFVVNPRSAVTLSPIVIGNNYSIEIDGKQVSAKLVGQVREFGIGRIFIDLDQYNDLVNGGKKVNNLMISLNDREYDNVIAAKKQVEQIIENSGMDVKIVETQAQRAKIIFDHLNIILMVILFMSLLVLLVSSMGMGSAMGINVIERTREIGVLRAIGATPKMVAALFVIEGFIISALSIVAGLLLALPMSVLAARFFGELILSEGTPLDFAFSEAGFIITLVVTLMFGYLASRVPAKRATKITVSEAIAYE